MCILILTFVNLAKRSVAPSLLHHEIIHLDSVNVSSLILHRVYAASYKNQNELNTT